MADGQDMGASADADRALAVPAEPQGVSALRASIPSAERERTLKESLARYMDPGAFRDKVSDAQRFTCPTVAKASAELLKRRRKSAAERAATAIRFFSKPGNLDRLIASAIEARRAETACPAPSQDESAVGEAETPIKDQETTNG